MWLWNLVDATPKVALFCWDGRVSKSRVGGENAEGAPFGTPILPATNLDGRSLERDLADDLSGAAGGWVAVVVRRAFDA
jgi:hypothetical protein